MKRTPWLLWLAFLALAVWPAFVRDARAWPPQPSGTDWWHLAANATSINPNWQTASWFIDPANATGNASDGNTGTSSSAPLLTWSELHDHRWGCAGSPAGCPRIQQSTTISFLSSQTTNADPIISFHTVENNSTVTFTCPLGAAQQVATGVLGTVTAKNRTTPQLLQAVLPAGTYAAGELVVNSTHPSRAWLNTLQSGTTWTLSQPLAPAAPPVSIVTGPAEVDTWTSGDTVTIYQPTAVNFVNVSPIFVDYGSAVNGTYISQCAGVAPGATLLGSGLQLGSGVTLVESSSVRQVTFASYAGDAYTQMINAYAVANGVTIPSVSSGFFAIIGGIVGTTINNGAFTLDGDVTLQPSALYNFSGGTSQIGLVYTGGAINPLSGVLNVIGATGFGYAGGPVVWGPGRLEPLGTARINYPAGAGKAAATFKVAALKANTSTVGCLGIPSAASAFASCNLALTAAQLDTSLGATSGCLGTPMGGGFCNFGQ